MNIRMTILACLSILFVGLAPLQAQDSFAEQVDLRPLSEIAVNTSGRLKSLGSHANAMMDAVSGPRKIGGRQPLFTYLDMMFRPDVYEDADVVYVKNKAVRQQVIASFENEMEKRPEILERFPDLALRMEVFKASGHRSQCA